MNPRGSEDAWVTPTSLEDWKTKHASTKLDLLAQIVVHHLAQDDAPPLKINIDGQTLECPTVKVVDPNAKQLEPDRVIIFSLFPSSNAGIKEVYHSHCLVSFLLMLPLLGLTLVWDQSSRAQWTNAAKQTQVGLRGIPGIHP